MVRLTECPDMYTALPPTQQQQQQLTFLYYTASAGVLYLFDFEHLLTFHPKNFVVLLGILQTGDKGTEIVYLFLFIRLL